MVRRNSNQRITKIKRDIDLDLLEQAELIPVEQGCTVMNPGDNLIPYPTINNLRSWVRKYLLQGINGIFISGFNVAEATAYKVSNAVTYQKTVPRKEERASGYIKFTTVLDGLIINTQEVKVIDCADEFQENENAPKPGLQLSNFHYLYEHEVTLPTNSYRDYNTAIFKGFRSGTFLNGGYSNYQNYIVGYKTPVWLMVGAIADNTYNYSYQWAYWDSDGILMQNANRGTNSQFFVYPYRQVDCSVNLDCPIYYYWAKVDWYNQNHRCSVFVNYIAYPFNYRTPQQIANSSRPNNLPDSVLFTYIKNLYCVPSYTSVIAYGNNDSLSNQLLQSPYTYPTNWNYKIKCSNGVETKELSIMPFIYPD